MQRASSSRLERRHISCLRRRPLCHGQLRRRPRGRSRRRPPVACLGWSCSPACVATTRPRQRSALRVGKGNPLLLDQIGQPLFDQICCSTAKSSGAPAEDSHELAVLVEQCARSFRRRQRRPLHPGSNWAILLCVSDRRPYGNLVGSAGDYVPVRQMCTPSAARRKAAWCANGCCAVRRTNRPCGHPLARLREQANRNQGQPRPPLDLGFSREDQGVGVARRCSTPSFSTTP